jgi:hypothetical protein
VDIALQILKPWEPRRLALVGGLAFLAGTVLLALGFTGLWPGGVVIGVSTVLVMPCLGVMLTWREERGVWMACVLTGAIALHGFHYTARPCPASPASRPRCAGR